MNGSVNQISKTTRFKRPLFLLKTLYNMIKKIKTILIPITICALFSGCEAVNDSLAVLYGEKPKPRFETPALPLESYKSLGSTMSCTQIGDAVKQTYKLAKKRMSDVDIYWEITPTNATYAQQDMYRALIQVGLEADDTSYTLFRQACNEYTATYQEVTNDIATTLYAYVDLIYRAAYLVEMEAHQKGEPYGQTKNKVIESSVSVIENDHSGVLDEVSRNINLMVLEETIRLIYPDNLMDVKSKSMPMPSLDYVRRSMAPQLVVNIKTD